MRDEISNGTIYKKTQQGRSTASGHRRPHHLCARPSAHPMHAALLPSPLSALKRPCHYKLVFLYQTTGNFFFAKSVKRQMKPRNARLLSNFVIMRYLTPWSQDPGSSPVAGRISTEQCSRSKFFELPRAGRPFQQPIKWHEGKMQAANAT